MCVDDVSRKKNVWIYSSNIFFIQGVKALVAETFSKRAYAIYVSDETNIINIASVNGVLDEAFVFSDTKNPLFLLCLSLFCRNLFSTTGGIEDVRRYLLSGRGVAAQDSHLQRNLSPRERDIVMCMKIRMTDDEIASKFKLSKKTVSAHRRNILSKLGIQNRNELYKCLFDLQR